jgi:uncharacterized membrane protein
MSGWVRTVTIGAAVGSGVLGGVYFTFSTFVVPALRKLPAGQAVGAMQAMNRAAPAPWVLVGLVGTGGACVVLAGQALAHLDDPGARWRLLGSALYLSTIGLTFAFHIPRNETLDRVDAEGAAAGEAWRAYVTSWTAGNHVRTLLAAAAAAVLTAAATLD